MKISPPIAPKFPHDITTHGHTRQDPYFWMRERDRPDLLEYLEAENNYVDSGMAHTKELQQTLYEEMVGRIQETDQSVPVEVKGYHYYTRTVEGLQYSVYCRRKGSMDSPEEVLLDPNQVAAESESDYLKIGIYDVSPDQNTLAYSLDFTGGERYTVHFKDLETGAILPFQIENAGYDFEWANDSQTVFFDRFNDEWRSFQIWRFKLGGEEQLVLQEDDVEFGVGLDKSRDDKYVMIEIDAAETSETYLIDADNPTRAPRLVAGREDGIEYWVDHRQDELYILTNRGGATNFKLCTAPADNPSPENWTELIAHRPDVRLADMVILNSHFVLLEREDGLERFIVQEFATGAQTEIPMDEPVYTIGGGVNPTFKADRFRYVYGSMTTPDTVMVYEFGSGERTILKQTPVLGYDPSRYETTRIWATAEDGAQVPISLVYQKGLELNGTNPCLLYGYGSYGVNQDPDFNSRWVSLVDRGFVCALAHVRGSETMGRLWYEDGKWLKKRNTFTDFVAAGRHLIAQGYTSAEKMAVWGRSAGGLLIGATVNIAPDMMAAAIADVPFVDVVSTMLDESIPLTTGEFREWGNPKDKKYYDYMLSYSPYDNVEAKEYPAILATSGYNDPRVQYWEPTKWVAKLRVTKTDDNPLFLHTNMGAGHSGSTGRYDYLKEYAFRLAFLIDQVG